MTSQHSPAAFAGPANLLHSLALLRWLAAVGQLLALWLAWAWLELPLHWPPLLWGLGALLLAAPLGWLDSQRHANVSGWHAATWLTLDLVQLSWQLWWSGGMANPFVTLYLVPLALVAVSLSRRAAIATLAGCLCGYALLVASAPPLPHHHGGADWFDLHLWGMAVNFVLTAMLFIGVLAHLVAQLRERDAELARLREQQAHAAGVVALGAQAAAMAHDLNTPLATLQLLSEELREVSMAPDAGPDALAGALDQVDQVITICRDRIRGLVAAAHDPFDADPSAPELDVWLTRTLERWSLLHPQIQLRIGSQLPASGLQLRRGPQLQQLLHALLDNAARATLDLGHNSLELTAALESPAAPTQLAVVIADRGGGMQAESAPRGLGLGLKLVRTLVDWLGGTLEHGDRPGGGTLMRLRLPLAPLLEEHPSS